MKSEVSVAFSATPIEIPAVGILVIVALFGLFMWDSLRLPAGLWFRWLMPVGFIPLMVGVQFNLLWLVVIGALMMGVGLGAGKYWRQRNSVR
ncbi:hypothetical protein [Streptomyces wuyuanensis]|uniref:hypothetical protein n=1 Tax=Streptomyces wuyuanensis TaxID=1196353 RepID=UPI0037157B93